MNLQTKTIEEFHKNDKISYTETIAILYPQKAHLYDRRRKHPDGHEWIRIGLQAKYYDNGQIAWALNYDNKGNVIIENNPSYRKDGTLILY